MSSQEIVFFDLPSKPPNKSWSGNTLKTRFALNYKGIPYKTEWIEYPDIKPRFQDHLPKKDLYTVPTIILPDGTWVTDSSEIAKVLEEKHPEPSLHLDSPYLPKYAEQLVAVFKLIGPVYVPGVYKRILNEPSLDYFRTTREKWTGTTLEKYEESGGEGGEKAWKAAAPHLQNITALLKENPDGPFFEGKTVGYVDFVHAAFLIFMRRIGEDYLEAALKASGDADVHLKLLEALKPWTERLDH
ncbi:putative glutathione S-transferase [Hypoxylon sp. NC0597]|nr:putative glutathione S-transferase [Hypoxylon sp. NC0597]